MIIDEPLQQDTFLCYNGEMGKLQLTINQPNYIHSV